MHTNGQPPSLEEIKQRRQLLRQQRGLLREQHEAAQLKAETKLLESVGDRMDSIYSVGLICSISFAR